MTITNGHHGSDDHTSPEAQKSNDDAEHDQHRLPKVVENSENGRLDFFWLPGHQIELEPDRKAGVEYLNNTSSAICRIQRR